MMTRHLAVVTMAALAVACGAACAQLGPMDSPPASAPASRPSKPVVIVQPTIDKAAHQISLPAAFWNEHLTSWVEVGLCGRPSDFLHETIVSITTTKTILMKSLREAGFRDADAWVANVQDFPRIRGDRALVLLEITREGKSEIFPLDELLVYQGWNVSIGPYGWMFKGDPERGPAATAPAVEGKDEEGKALSPREQILRDDPQIALQFKGLQHLSRSFMDHPLCYDDWLYPNSRYFRNYTVQPRVLTVPPLDDKAEPAPAGETPEARKARTLAVFWRKIYDSNGDVDVKLTIRKVSDEEFLKACAEYWHDPAFVAYLDQKVNGKSALETARVLDYHKDLLWKTLPLLRKKIADAKVVDPEQPLNESREFRSVAMWAAKIEAGYATLDAAWTNWACDHAKFEGSSPEQMAELKAQAKLWQEHMELKRRRAWFLARAEDWSIPWSMDTAPSERTWQGMQMEARSEALLAENQQTVTYWQAEKARTSDDDPRKEWREHIDLQVKLALAKDKLGHAGVDFGLALQKNQTDTPEVKDKQRAYQRAALEAGLYGLKLRLADVNFEIGKREGLDGDPDLPNLLKQRDELRKQVDAAAAATQKAAS